MLVNTVSRSINSKHVVACSSQQRMLMEQPGQTTSASAHYSAHNHTTTQAAAPANHIQTHPSVQGHRSISTGTRPCHERNRLRPPSHESYPGHLGETIHQELAEDDSELRESLDPDDGFADEGDEVDADDDVDDDGEDRPLEEMVDDELFGPDSDEEADDDPLVQEIKRASKKRQLFLLRQYMKEALPVLDQEEEYKRIIEENEKQGLYRFRMKLIDINRITKVTRQGRIQRYSAMVLVGNGEGAVGIGKGKSLHVNTALRKAHVRALKNHVVIPRYRRSSVYFPTTFKYVKSRVNIWPKAIGRGIVANDNLKDILTLIGFSDVGVKVIGSTHPRNVVKALIGGLLSIPDPCDLARDQGKVVLELAPGKHHIPVDELVVRLGLRHPKWPDIPPEDNWKEQPRYLGPIKPWWYV